MSWIKSEEVLHDDGPPRHPELLDHRSVPLFRLEVMKQPGAVNYVEALVPERQAGGATA